MLAVGYSDVVLLLQRVDAADLCGLLALARGHRRNFALAIERPHALVDPPRQEHQLVESAQIVVGQIGFSKLGFGCRHTFPHNTGTIVALPAAAGRLPLACMCSPLAEPLLDIWL